MIKAGALTYSIFVMVVAGVLCLLMISMAYMNRSFFIQVDVHDVVRDNAHSGIALGTSIPHNTDYDQWVDLYQEGRDSTRVKRRIWGAFRVVSSKAKTKGESYSKCAIIGYENEKLNETALWLSDHNRPLKLAGDALLKGNCFLPEKGVDRAYVEGSNFKPERLVHGSSQKSKERVPAPEKVIKEYWLDYLMERYQPNDSIIAFEELPLKLTHSFHQRTIVATSTGVIKLDGYQLKGNIILYSKSGINVSSNSSIEEAILVSTEIKFDNSFKGKTHAIATDTILVGRQVELGYPSSLIMIARNQRLPYCLISEKAIVSGAVLSFAEGIARSNKLSLEVNQDGTIRGLVYCEDNFELSGTVEGSVICNRFLLATPSGIYENHILDGKIDRSRLPENFASLRIDNLENEAKTVSWLPY